MDESFLLRARRLLDERSAKLDHRTLVAKISSQAAETPTARASAAVNRDGANDDGNARLASLVLGEGDWRAAVRRQGGCFNRAAAKQRVNIL